MSEKPLKILLIITDSQSADTIETRLNQAKWLHRPMKTIMCVSCTPTVSITFAAHAAKP